MNNKDEGEKIQSGANYYGSENVIDPTSLVAKFRSIIDNKAAKWILSRFAKDQKGLEHLLAVFSGVEKPSNPVESLEIKL